MQWCSFRTYTFLLENGTQLTKLFPNLATGPRTMSKRWKRNIWYFFRLLYLWFFNSMSLFLSRSLGIWQVARLSSYFPSRLLHLIIVFFFLLHSIRSLDTLCEYYYILSCLYTLHSSLSFSHSSSNTHMQPATVTHVVPIYIYSVFMDKGLVLNPLWYPWIFVMDLVLRSSVAASDVCLCRSYCTASIVLYCNRMVFTTLATIMIATTVTEV